MVAVLAMAESLAAARISLPLRLQDAAPRPQMTNEQPNPLRDSLLNLPLVDAPNPWTKLDHFAIGGLTEIGYAPHSDILLVVSSQGRGLFDCCTGSRLARDSADDWDGLDETILVSPGFDRYSELLFRLAGLHGGGLPMTTADGWGLHCVALSWPEHCIFMTRPWESDRSGKWIKIATDGACEFRACGFSETGQSFVVASSCELIIFSREKA